ILGSPILAGWAVRGYWTSDETGWSEGHVWVPVIGPRGSGTIQARAGQGTGSWAFTQMELTSPHLMAVNLLDAPAAPIGVRQRGPVYLVRLGTTDVDLDSLPAQYRSAFGTAVSVLPPLKIDPKAYNSSRGQYSAQRLLASMHEQLPDIDKDQYATVIGVID